jgi:hypothetical protein
LFSVLMCEINPSTHHTAGSQLSATGYETHCNLTTLPGTSYTSKDPLACV